MSSVRALNLCVIQLPLGLLGTIDRLVEHFNKKPTMPQRKRADFECPNCDNQFRDMSSAAKHRAQCARQVKQLKEPAWCIVSLHDQCHNRMIIKTGQTFHSAAQLSLMQGVIHKSDVSNIIASPSNQTG
eukprot:scaffold92123_cov16-Prasinocladus_malaysianus.AAC.1